MCATLRGNMSHKLIVRAADLALDLQDLAATSGLPAVDANLLEAVAAAIQTAVDLRLGETAQPAADAFAQPATQLNGQARSRSVLDQPTVFQQPL